MQRIQFNTSTLRPVAIVNETSSEESCDPIVSVKFIEQLQQPKEQANQLTLRAAQKAGTKTLENTIAFRREDDLSRQAQLMSPKTVPKTPILDMVSPEHPPKRSFVKVKTL